MKKLLILSAVILSASLVACNKNDKTELAFINDASSDGAINDIVWADGDAKWTKDGGYAKSAKTEAKEVNALNGSVQCTVSTDGTNFAVASVIIPEVNASSLTLKDNESQVYTILVTSKSAKSADTVTANEANPEVTTENVQ